MTNQTKHPTNHRKNASRFKTFASLTSTISISVVLLGTVVALALDLSNDPSAIPDATPAQPRHLSSAEVILDHDFPDPATLLADDGYHYAYATQGVAEDGSGTIFNIQVARSRDLKSWEHLGDALPRKPQWANKTQKFWAPHVDHNGHEYVLYFSGEPNYGNGLCLGVATSALPTGPFVAQTKPLACGKGFENIDPQVFDDPVSGEKFLVWGSGFGPIRLRQLTDDGLNFATASAEIPLIFPLPQHLWSVGKRPFPRGLGRYDRLIEGAWLIYAGSQYYLFFSGDNCCNPNPHYAVMVARSKTLTGPYEILSSPNGEPLPILESFDRFLAPGHNSIVDDALIDPLMPAWIIFHAIDLDRPVLGSVIPGDRDVRRSLLRARLEWVNGWPRVL